MQHRSDWLFRQIDNIDNNMANLLPQDKKNKIRKEYKIRVATISLFMFEGVLIIAMVLLASLYILLNSRLSSFDQAYATNTGEEEDIARLERSINEIRTKLGLLQYNDSSLKIPYGVFKSVIDIKPENISLTKMAYLNNNQVTVSGFARYRKNLQDFVVAIGEHELFLPVEYPFSNITQKQDIDFSLTINMTTEDEK